MSSVNVSEDQWGLRSLIALTRAERVVDTEAIPWVPYTDSIWVKPLRLNRKTGFWANFTKVEGAGQLNRHYHAGPVSGYVLEGSWRYAEKDWVARPGTFVWEPPGDVHTLISNPEGTTTLFQLEGAILYVDEHDNVVDFEDVLTFTKRYHDYCSEQGIEPVDLDY